MRCDTLSWPEVPTEVDRDDLASGESFHAGESLQLTISGARIIPAELNMPSKVPLRNHGTHVLHTGGQHDSHLLIPVAPAADL